MKEGNLFNGWYIPKLSKTRFSSEIGFGLVDATCTISFDLKILQQKTVFVP